MATVLDMRAEQRKLTEEFDKLVGTRTVAQLESADFDRAVEICERRDVLAVLIQEQEKQGAQAARDRTHMHGLPTRYNVQPSSLHLDLMPVESASRIIAAYDRNRSYRRLFGNVPHSNVTTSMLLDCILNKVYNPDVMAMQAVLQAQMGGQVDSRGGLYLTPLVEARLLDGLLHGGSIVMSLASIMPMIAREVVVAGLDGLDQSDPNTIYGFYTYWHKEGAADGTPQVPQTRAVNLIAKSALSFYNSSVELLQDFDQLESILFNRGSVAMGNALDNAFFNGNGANQPLGILNSPCLIAVSEGDAAVGEILYENIATMYSRVLDPANAVWVISPTTLPQLLMSTISVGDGGSHVPLIQQGADGSMTILTRPVFVSSKLPTVGNEGDVLLANFAAYQVGVRQGIALARSDHVQFTSNNVVWRISQRLDGQPLMNKAYTGQDSITYSPFVVCETRT